jgi:thiol-disulfide isomerase/thioredoxin
MSQDSTAATRGLALLFSCLLAGVATPSQHAALADTPATQPAISQQAAQDDVRAEYKKARQEEVSGFNKFWTILGDESELHDPSSHARLLAQLKPVYKETQQALSRELQLWEVVGPSMGASTRPSAPVSPTDKVEQMQAWFLESKAALIAVGDTEVLEQTRTEAKSTDDHLAKIPQLTLLLAELMEDADPASQDRTLDKMAALLRTADVKDRHFASVIMMLMKPHSPIPPAKTEAFLNLVEANYHSDFLAKFENDKAILAAVGNKPLTLAGTTVEGKAFSTEQWKGKVILVDFWASWCVPCKKELPRVKAMYQKYHDQGLEVLGVSNDYTKAALDKYLAADPALAWPCLFDEAAAENHKWNPLTQKCGIEGIPLMMLIDRTGICRTVEAVQNMETLIPRLLAEPEQANSGAVEQSKTAAE